MIEVDGSVGEGGGQIIRTAVTLSAITGIPVRINNIRANRPNPGLSRQHKVAIEAAAEICHAVTTGVDVRSQCIYFQPVIQSSSLALPPSCDDDAVAPPAPPSISPSEYYSLPRLKESYQFNIGSAGSCSLVLQTILPIILHYSSFESASTPSSSSSSSTPSILQPITIDIMGGTHNPFAPPFEFLRDVYLPQLRKMGIEANIDLLQYGFYPTGGGHLRCILSPWRVRIPFHLVNPGALMGRSIVSYSLNKSRSSVIAALSAINSSKGNRRRNIDIVELKSDESRGSMNNNIDKSSNGSDLRNSNDGGGRMSGREGKRKGGSGHYIIDRVDYGHASDMITTIVDKDTTSLCSSVELNDDGEYAVGEYLSDQLLVPMIISGVTGGQFTLKEPSLHFTTNIAIIELFYPNKIRLIGHSVYVD